MQSARNDRGVAASSSAILRRRGRFEQCSFVTVTGPRHSRKTTLCRREFARLRYVDLDEPNRRDFAETDPVRFLDQVGTGTVLDEIQRVPRLVPYLGLLSDRDERKSLFVLASSEQFGLS